MVGGHTGGDILLGQAGEDQFGFLAGPGHDRFEQKSQTIVQQQEAKDLGIVLDVLEQGIPDLVEKNHRVLDQIPGKGQVKDLVKLVQPVLGHTDQKLIQPGIVPEVGPVANISPAGDVLDGDILVALFHGFGD